MLDGAGTTRPTYNIRCMDAVLMQFMVVRGAT